MKLTVDQTNDIDRSRERQVPTRRATVPEVEEILYEAFPVLDQGFIRVVDYMGTMPPSCRPPGSPTGRERRKSVMTAASSGI